MVAGDRDAGGCGVDAGLAVRWDQLSAAAFPLAAATADAMDNPREQVSYQIMLWLNIYQLHLIVCSN